MITYCQEKIKPDECKKMTLNVLKAVLEKNSEVFEYNYQLNLIAQFLLVFCSEANTYVLLSMIFQMLMPNQMGIGDELEGIQEQEDEDQDNMIEQVEVEGTAFEEEHIEMIVEIISNQFKLNQNQLDAIQTYLSHNYDSLFKYLLLN